MGIQGLLPFLKDIHCTVHISKYRGQTVAVDTYVWLHRGAFACAFELATGVPTTKYVDYCVRQVHLLLNHDIRPLMVFDGGCLPMKAGTEQQRRRRREENMRKGHHFLRDGKRSKATEYFQQCVDVTPRMASELIKVLRQMNIECIVAPYEADAQITFLLKSGLAAAAITEDSDLLVFGCATVLLKLDKEGNAVEISIDDFGRISGMESWTHRRFRQMCILSGCDYLESPQGVGIKKAHSFLRYKSAEEVIKSWRWGKAVNAPKCPSDYLERFRLAELTFLHQRVYDPRKEAVVHLTPLPDDIQIDVQLTDFLGPDLPSHIARGIAMGILDPDSKTPFDTAGEQSATTMHHDTHETVHDEKENVTSVANVQTGEAVEIAQSSVICIVVNETKPRDAAASLVTPPNQPVHARMLNLRPHRAASVLDTSVKVTPTVSPFFKGLAALRDQACNSRPSTSSTSSESASKCVEALAPRISPGEAVMNTTSASGTISQLSEPKKRTHETLVTESTQENEERTPDAASSSEMPLVKKTKSVTEIPVSMDTATEITNGSSLIRSFIFRKGAVAQGIGARLAAATSHPASIFSRRSGT